MGRDRPASRLGLVYPRPHPSFPYSSRPWAPRARGVGDPPPYWQAGAPVTVASNCHRRSRAGISGQSEWPLTSAITQRPCYRNRPEPIFQAGHAGSIPVARSSPPSIKAAQRWCGGLESARARRAVSLPCHYVRWCISACLTVEAVEDPVCGSLQGVNSKAKSAWFCCVLARPRGGNAWPRLAAFTVCSRKTATVIGPTPPRTGVMNPAALRPGRS